MWDAQRLQQDVLAFLAALVQQIIERPPFSPSLVSFYSHLVALVGLGPSSLPFLVSVVLRLVRLVAPRLAPASPVTSLVVIQASLALVSLMLFVASPASQLLASYSPSWPLA